jgi:Tol biopolymer transport system component
MRLRYIFVAGIGLVVGLLIVVLWKTPRVTAWLPDTNEIRAGQNITFKSNTPLSAENLESRFQISPNISGDIRIEGQSNYFDPSEPLEYGKSYTVTLSPGIRGENGLSSLMAYEKQYSVSDPELLFVREDNNKANLWSQYGSRVAVQISDEPNGIWDYSVLPNGKGVLVSSLNEDGSTDLVRIFLAGTRDVLLDCQGDLCLDGRWQPDGALVAFEKTNGVTEVWLLDTSSGTEMPVHEFAVSTDDDLLQGSSRFARWSADGRYLSFYMPDRQQLAFIDMQNGDLWTVPANVDLMGDWSLSSYKLAFTELVFNESHEEENLENGGVDGLGSSSTLNSRVIVLDIKSMEMVDLGGTNQFLEGVPAWSPDGTMVAASRAVDGIRQIWTIPIDGSGPETLTGDRLYTNSSPKWSPDGRHLALMRSRVESINESAGIWLFDLEDGRAILVAEEAYLLGWLP